MTEILPGAEPLTLKPVSPLKLNGGNQLLQTGFWGDFKAVSGWTSRAFYWQSGGDLQGFEGRFLILERSFPGGFKMAYVPYGPALPTHEIRESGAILTAIAKELKKYLSQGCFVVRFDLCGGTSGPVGSDISAPPSLLFPLRKAPYRVQPPDTVLLPLTDSEGLSLDEESLLAGMHKKTRYNIRLAAKKKVEVTRHTGESAVGKLADWYLIYRETGERDGISLHPESYYRRLLEMSVSDNSSAQNRIPKIDLYVASHEGEDLAGIIVSRSGGRSVYMYGASSTHKRELMPNHLLQWTAIRDALNEGAEEYDFFGIPPANDPSHPMHGLWRFKTGFGGNLHHYSGAWDYSYSPFIYTLYSRAEKLRGKLAALRKRR